MAGISIDTEGTTAATVLPVLCDGTYSCDRAGFSALTEFSNGVVAVVVSRVEGLVVCAFMTTSGRGCTPLDVESSVGDTDSCTGAVCDRVGSEE